MPLHNLNVGDSFTISETTDVGGIANTNINVTNYDSSDLPSIDIQSLNNDKRVIEISRMLSGSPDSENAQKHAIELLENAK